MSTKSIEDAKRLQYDLNSFAEWSDENGLTFNIKKCHAISYYKGSAHFSFDYYISNLQLTRVDSIKDLGVVFDSAVTFTTHIYYIISKASRSLGFIKRTTSDFTDISSIIYLYKTIILLTL